MAILTQYDLTVIDEVSMLTAEHFERVLAIWKYADKLPCWVLAGDFWQLPVVDQTAERCELSRAKPSNAALKPRNPTNPATLIPRKKRYKPYKTINPINPIKLIKQPVRP